MKYLGSTICGLLEDECDVIEASMHVPKDKRIFVGEGRLAARVAGIFASISSVACS